MQQVTFRQVEGRHVPCQPWPQVFFISPQLLCQAPNIELRPLTLAGLLKGVGRNFVAMNLWRLVNVLWRAGLLNTVEGKALSVREHWTWTPWRTLAARRGKG